MKFSVIVPVYNVEKYIKRCIESLVQQTFKEFEIIVIDDGSTDKSIEILNQTVKRYHREVRLFRQKNSGLGAARNTGIEQAEGEYLVFVDSDDYVETSMLKKLNQYLKNQNYDMLIFNSILVNEKGKFIQKFDMCNHIQGVYTAASKPEILTLKPAAWNKVCRKEFWIKHNIQFPKGLIYEDTAVCRILMERAASVCLCNEYLYYYVQRSSSIVRNSLPDKMMDILTVNGQMIEAFQKNKCFQKYYAELEFIAVTTILLFILEKINETDCHSSRQKILVDFMKKHYPKCHNNKYLDKESRERTRLLMEEKFLLYYRKFGRKQKWKSVIRTILPVRFISWYVNR